MIAIEKEIPVAAIERGIPITPQPRATVKYPWHEMEIGDSFLMEGKDTKTASANASATGSRIGKKFSCRKVDGGVRVWRLS
jgi:hypothetical protein